MNDEGTNFWKLAEPWLIMALAFALRAALIDNISVEHFDEGVYASGYFSDHIGYQYPDQHLYAPPLFPTLLRSVLFYSGGNPHSVVWVNVVVGTLLVGAVWLVTRDWFGQPAAFVAGLLLATNEFAIHFSRSVLTDALLCLWMTLSVWAGWKAIHSGSMRWMILAGFLSAAAWWTKYNGWLTLTITGAATVGMVVFEHHSKGTASRLLLRWLGTVFVAVLLWSPFLWSIQPIGGYAAVAANHAGYFGGWGNWWSAAVRQQQVEQYITSGHALTVMAAFLASLLLWKVSTGFSFRLLRIAVVIGMISCGVLLPAVLVAAGILILWGEVIVRQRRSEQTGSLGAVWVAVAWGTGLALAVPLYRPYPRLLLPAGIGLLLIVGSEMSTKFRDQVRPGLGKGVAVVLSLLLFVGSIFWNASSRGEFSAWKERTSFSQTASSLLEDVESRQAELPPSKFEEASSVIYVLGEPGLYYHLAAERGLGGKNHRTQPASNLDLLKPGATSPGIPVFLVTSLHAHHDHPELLTDPPAELELLKEYNYLPSDLVLLDDMGPGELAQNRQSKVRLWLVKVSH